MRCAARPSPDPADPVGMVPTSTVAGTMRMQWKERSARGPAPHHRRPCSCSHYPPQRTGAARCSDWHLQHTSLHIPVSPNFVRAQLKNDIHPPPTRTNVRPRNSRTKMVPVRFLKESEKMGAMMSLSCPALPSPPLPCLLLPCPALPCPAPACPSLGPVCACPLAITIHHHKNHKKNQHHCDGLPLITIKSCLP